MKSNRDDFSQKTIDVIAKRTGYRCSNSDCYTITTGPQEDTEKSINIGVAAHISGAAPGGPRYRAELSSEERKSAMNGIWLCQSCSKLIDNDLVRYPESLLTEWKKKAEKLAQIEIEKKEKPSFTIQSILDQNISFRKKLMKAIDVYAKSRFHDIIKEKLKEKRVLTIEGLPKIGKTFIMHNIGFELSNEENYILEISSPGDIKYEKKLNQIYLCDDIFGSSSLDYDRIKDWEENWNNIEKIIDEKHFLLCTSRTTILNEARVSSNIPFNSDENRIKIDINDFEDDEFKAAVFDKQVEFSPLASDNNFSKRKSHLMTIKRKIIGRESFFPEDIRLLIRDVIPKLKESISLEDFEEQVLYFLDHANTYLIEEMRRLAFHEFLILLIVYSGTTKVNGLKETFINISKAFGLDIEDLFDEALEKFDGDYITAIDNFLGARFDHPSIEESFKAVLHRDKKWLPYIKFIGGKNLIRDVAEDPSYSKADKEDMLKKIYFKKSLEQVTEYLDILTKIDEELVKFVLKGLISDNLYPILQDDYTKSRLYGMRNFLSSLIKFKGLIQTGSIEWFEKVLLDKFHRDTSKGYSDLREIGSNLTDFEFMTEIFPLLEELDTLSFNNIISKNPNLITTLKQRFDDILHQILQNYLPQGIELYNKYGSSLLDILGKFGFEFQNYDDTAENKKYIEEKEREKWSSWREGPISEMGSLIDGGSIRIRFRCCGEEYQFEDIEVPAPYIGGETIGESERYSDSEEVICDNCEKEYIVVIANNLTEFQAYWDSNEPECLEYKVSYTGFPEEDDDFWETWP